MTEKENAAIFKEFVLNEGRQGRKRLTLLDNCNPSTILDQFENKKASDELNSLLMPQYILSDPVLQ